MRVTQEKSARWRWVVWGALAAAGGVPGAWAQSPPYQRNLLVEWRMSASSERQHQGAGLRGGEITVDSNGGLQGQGSVGISSTTRSRSETGLQQVRVLNGGKARIYLGSSRPVTQWQIGVSGAAGGADAQQGDGGMNGRGNGPRWQAWSSTTLVDTGRGITVRPRWQGGKFATVELEAKVAQQTAYAPDGQTDSTEVMTTVQVPMGAWTEVARRGGQVQQSRRGTLSTEEVSREDHEVLEMRVSVP